MEPKTKKELNPTENLFSVAPIGQIVVIGRGAALKAGLERSRAINLLVWLMIATKATASEIREELRRAYSLTNVVGLEPSSVEAYIGDVDAEEKEAIDAATQPPTAEVTNG